MDTNPYQSSVGKPAATKAFWRTLLIIVVFVTAIAGAYALGFYHGITNEDAMRRWGEELQRERLQAMDK